MQQSLRPVSAVWPNNRRAMDAALVCSPLTRFHSVEDPTDTDATTNKYAKGGY